jgi:hypothetical protein
MLYSAIVYILMIPFIKTSPVVENQALKAVIMPPLRNRKRSSATITKQERQKRARKKTQSRGAFTHVSSSPSTNEVDVCQRPCNSSPIESISWEQVGEGPQGTARSLVNEITQVIESRVTAKSELAPDDNPPGLSPLRAASLGYAEEAICALNHSSFNIPVSIKSNQPQIQLH